MEQLYDTINESYYRDVDEQDVVDGACKGLWQVWAIRTPPI